MTDTPLSAYVDESIASDSNMYVMAALLVPDKETTALRRAILEESPTARSGDKYFHAVDANREQQGRLLLAIQRTSPKSWYVTTCFVKIRRGGIEAARQACLAELLRETTQRGVTAFTLDSREDPRATDPRAANRKDLATFNALKAMGLVTPSATMIHVDDKKVPLLWGADCVAWLVRRGLQDNDPSQGMLLRQRLSLIRAHQEWRDILAEEKAKAGGPKFMNQTRPSESPGVPERHWPDDYVTKFSQQYSATSSEDQKILDDYLKLCDTSIEARLQELRQAKEPLDGALRAIGPNNRQPPTAQNIGL